MLPSLQSSVLTKYRQKAVLYKTLHVSVFQNGNITLNLKTESGNTQVVSIYYKTREQALTLEVHFLGLKRYSCAFHFLGTINYYGTVDGKCKKWKEMEGNNLYAQLCRWIQTMHAAESRRILPVLQNYRNRSLKVSKQEIYHSK